MWASWERMWLIRAADDCWTRRSHSFSHLWQILIIKLLRYLWEAHFRHLNGKMTWNWEKNLEFWVEVKWLKGRLWRAIIQFHIKLGSLYLYCDESQVKNETKQQLLNHHQYRSSGAQQAAASCFFSRTFKGLYMMNSSPGSDWKCKDSIIDYLTKTCWTNCNC